MQEWNVIISVNDKGFKRAFEVLPEYGTVKKTDFYNVLLMKVDDVPQFIDNLRNRSIQEPGYLSFMSRLVPVTTAFIFRSPEEFEMKAKDIVLDWVTELAGKSFHVRMRRRGFKGRLSSLDEEHFLDNILLESMVTKGKPGRITFEDPDAIIAVETVAQWAGLSLWKREDLKQYPFIRLN
jgi:tRNA(Ser,Leu) C12 N-acetylase TAN1